MLNEARLLRKMVEAGMADEATHDHGTFFLMQRIYTVQI